MIAEPITVEAILTDTRPVDRSDYRSWGRAAAAVVSGHPVLAEAELIGAMTAKARSRVTREQKRTGDGVARMLADIETGQASLWMTWVDPIKVRATGERIEAEGGRKTALGQRMQQAADCMDAHEGLSAYAAWLAEDLDPAALDAAEDQEEAVG